MKNFIILIAIVLFTFSCSSIKHNKPEERKENISNPSVEIPSEVEQNKKISLKVDGIELFNQAHQDKFNGVLDKCEYIINTPKFVNNFHSIKFRNEYTNGKTHTQILQEIMSGKDNYENEADKVINIHIKPFTSKNPWSSVKGYTTEGSKYVYENTRWILRVSDCDTCAHFIHEYTHNLGYSHPKWDKSFWDYTVPYAVGNYVNELCEELENNNIQGYSQVGKAMDFDSMMRLFESVYPCQFINIT